MAKHVIGFEGTGRWAPFLTVGSLEYDGDLDRADAVAANDLLTLSPASARATTAEERARYLKTATLFVKNIRATIFANVVRTVLEKEFGLEVGEIPRGGKKRKDLTVTLNPGGTIRVFPVWPAECGGWWNKQRVEDRAQDLAKRSTPALLVVPPLGNLFDIGAEGVKLVRLDEMVHAAAAGHSLDFLTDESAHPNGESGIR